MNDKTNDEENSKTFEAVIVEDDDVEFQAVSMKMSKLKIKRDILQKKRCDAYVCRFMDADYKEQSIMMADSIFYDLREEQKQLVMSTYVLHGDNAKWARYISSDDFDRAISTTKSGREHMSKNAAIIWIGFLILMLIITFMGAFITIQSLHQELRSKVH